MDNSETHYLTYSPDDIWDAMQDAYDEAGGDALYPGDEKEMLLRAAQAVIVQAFAGIDNALRMQTLRYAVGDYLDLIGETRGVLRNQAAKATGNATFSAIIGQTLPVTYPAGSMLTADGNTWYVTDEDVTLSISVLSLTVGITAVEAGSAGNALVNNTTMTLDGPFTSIPQIKSVGNASGGEDEEDDDAYRARIAQEGLNGSNAGSKAFYESVAEDASTSVIDAKAYHDEDDPGYVYIYLALQTGAPYDTISNVIYSELNKTKPMTDNVLIRQATDVPYYLMIVYDANTGVSSSDLLKAKYEFEKWQNNEIGRAFTPEKMVALLYQAGIEHITSVKVNWSDDPTTGTWVDAEYTETDPDKRLIGEVILAQSGGS